MTDRFIIEGSRITDIPALYAELNRVFMEDEDWTLGASLDALDDLLYGGYGKLLGMEQATVVWRNMDISRASLGLEATRQWLQQKLALPGFSTTRINQQLQALEDGTGQTYFDIVLEIFAAHPNIRLQPSR